MGMCMSNSAKYQEWAYKVDGDPSCFQKAPPELRRDRDFVFKVVKGNSEAADALQYASEELRNDKDFVLRVVGVDRRGKSLKYAAEELRQDRDFVRKAVKRKCGALRYAADDVRKDKEFVLELVKANWRCLAYAADDIKEEEELVTLVHQTEEYQEWLSKILADEAHLQEVPVELRDDKHLVLEAVKRKCQVYASASDRLQRHKEIQAEFLKQTWSSKIIENAQEMQKAPKRLRENRQFILEVVKQNGFILEFAHRKLQNDREIVSEVIAGNDYWAFKYASNKMKDDDELVVKALEKDGGLLRFASKRIRGDKEVVLIAVKQRGTALQYAADDLRMDKDVVKVAASNTPDALKFALGDTIRDKDCLIAAGIWDHNHDDDISSRRSLMAKLIVLSTRFSLKAESEFEATNFTKLFKGHDFVKKGNFVVYSPNAFDKNTCDPNWTNFDHPCRGTTETCRMDTPLKTGFPQPKSCWRYSYRYQLDEAKKSEGFMLQLVEAEEARGSPQQLGDGQRIEMDMAQDIGTKIFHVHRPRYEAAQLELSFTLQDMEKVVEEIQNWYKGGCKDMSVCTLHFPRKL